MQYLLIFDIKYNIFIQKKGILNRNHDYAMLDQNNHHKLNGNEL